jgi:sugar (pentulose or hexulose) kinase
MPKPAFLFLIRDAGWERIKADVVARPTRMLKGRAFAAATGAASAGAKSIA